MEFFELKVFCDPDNTDLLIAEFSQYGFDSFVENEKGFSSYLETNSPDEKIISAIQSKYSEFLSFEFQLKKVEKRNWNAEWEKDYEPIFIDDQCVVKASFHRINKKYLYEIIINPKMSFGTGHHETTFLMLKAQLKLDHKDKSVMDIGCGTGILSIMATKRGASHIYACDIDDWCIENSKENFAINNCNNITLGSGTVDSINATSDIIIANINRNVLLNDMEAYYQKLNKGGHLLISGFFEEDDRILTNKANTFKLTKINKLARNNWSCLLFKK